MEFDWQIVARNFPELFSGMTLTLKLTVISLLAGGILSLVICQMLISRNPLFRVLGQAHVLFYRGTPLLVQIFLLYYGLGQFSAFFEKISMWWFFKEAYYCGLLALSLNTSAYLAEILRGGIEAVPPGEKEAALSLGMSRLQVFRSVVLPRAFRFVFPSLGNEAVLLIKSTSLTSVITLMELTGIAQKLASDLFAPIEIFLASGLIYLCLIGTVSVLFRLAEKRWVVPC